MAMTLRLAATIAAALLLCACGPGEGGAAVQASGESSRAAPQPVGAGSVTGTIGGKRVELYVLGSQSDHGTSHLSLYVLGEGLGEKGLGALSLGAEWIGDLGGEFSSADVAIRIPGSEPSRIYHGSIDDGLSLNLTDATLVGETLQLAGHVRGTLTAMDLTGLRNPDPEDTLDIDLAFEAAID